MLNVQRGKQRVGLVDLAVLTTITGPLTNERARRFVHQSLLAGLLSLGLSLQNRNELVGSDVTDVF